VIGPEEPELLVASRCHCYLLWHERRPSARARLSGPFVPP
jgi:hypothetical protein